LRMPAMRSSFAMSTDCRMALLDALILRHGRPASCASDKRRRAHQPGHCEVHAGDGRRLALHRAGQAAAQNALIESLSAACATLLASPKLAPYWAVWQVD